MKPSLKRFLVVSLVLLIPLLAVYELGYFGRQGQVRQSRKVKALFRSNALPPQYLYYERSDAIEGTYGIAGLDPDYTIDSPGWKAWAPDTTALERLMQRLALLGAQPAEGFEILSPENEVIGIFYSALPDPVIHIKSGRYVTIALDIPEHLRKDH
jgi:hypothetical protein